MRRITTLSILFLAILSTCSQYALPQVLKLRNIVDIGTSAVFWPAAIVVPCHELGHAAAAKLLCNTPLNISLGALPGKKSAPLFTKGGISLDSFDFLKGGYCNFSTTTEAYNLPINAAGPLGGILSLLLCQKIANALPDPALQKIYASMIRVFLAHQLLYGFTPILDVGRGNGDGTKIWRHFGLPVEPFVAMAPLSTIAFLIGSLSYATNTIDQQMLHTRNKHLLQALKAVMAAKTAHIAVTGFAN